MITIKGLCHLIEFSFIDLNNARFSLLRNWVKIDCKVQSFILHSPFLETTSIYAKLLLQMLLIYMCVLIQTCTPVSGRVCVVSVC